jgi:hypothetical protein
MLLFNKQLGTPFNVTKEHNISTFITIREKLKEKRKLRK